MANDLEREYYETTALWADERVTAQIHQRIEQTIGLMPEDAHSVLDAGCGNGLLTERLARDRFAVGADRSRHALSRFVASRCQADVAALPFGDAAFDCVLCAEVIEHLPQAVYGAVLRELARVARRYILITVPYCEDLLTGHVVCPACRCRFNANYHLRAFDEATLRTLYGAYPHIRLARLAGLISERTRRLNRLWATLLLLRYDLLGAPDLAQHMQCPHCGYRRTPDGPATQPAVAQHLGVASAIERLWPKRDTYRWWIALYEKAGS